MRVKEIMSMSVQACAPEDTLEAVAQRLWEHDCGCLPVVDRDGRPQAMITDRDVCMAAYTRGKPLAQLRTADSMSNCLATCRPEDDIAVAARTMREHQVRRLPVVGNDGRLAGIVSLNDLAGAADEAAPARIADAAAAEALRSLIAICRRRETTPAVVPARPAAAAPARPVGRKPAKAAKVQHGGLSSAGA